MLNIGKQMKHFSGILFLGMILVFFAASCHKETIELSPIAKFDIVLTRGDKSMNKSAVTEFSARVLVEYEYDTIEHKCMFVENASDGVYMYDAARSDVMSVRKETPFRVYVEAVIDNNLVYGESETLTAGNEAVIVSIVLNSDDVSGIYIDLGLPSGTLWAQCNLGAKRPEQYGTYYSWGETATKDLFSWDTYSIGNELDSLAYLDASHDAAVANWGGNWRMPSREDFEELNASCTREWTTRNNVKGYLLTGSNGNSIFLPAAGGRGENNIYEGGSCGFYWLNSAYADDTEFAWGFILDEESFYETSYYRMYGQTIRPVCNR